MDQYLEHQYAPDVKDSYIGVPRDNVGPKPQFPLESRTMSLLQSFMSMRVLFSPRLDWLIANDF